jgi:hypothetical protein
MSAITELSDKLKGQVFDFVGALKKRFFGANNERLDFIMDSFYKLPPSKRNGVFAGIVFFIAAIVLGAVMIYFSQVNALKDELKNSFNALHELKELSAEYNMEERKFEKLLADLQRRTAQFKMKPFFEKISKDLNIQIERLEEKKIPIPADNPMADKVSEINVDMHLPNISIPRLLNFLVEVERSKHFLRVKDLQVRGRFGTKLFFDAYIKIRGYEVTTTLTR